ncbi:MAG: hypothetical protein DYG98_00915 [Haliscomenobacteraceae bacterium CHB4]|nr:hypothetical protein [Haliscomenobacteraceae bacterium CHB4]
MEQEGKKVKLSSLQIDGEPFYMISDIDELRPFFMSIVSDANHWMFISSNGGLTAGRKNAECALFPYYTDDKITESAEITGSKSVFQVMKNDTVVVWEPFSMRCEGKFKIQRNLYKSAYHNKILFEEINHELGLTFQYQWNFSDAFGFIKKSKLINHSGEHQNVAVLDGMQNIVPYGVGSELQNRVSNLTDAYKRSELERESGLGIFALSAIIVDKAEPSEALKATVAFSTGLENPRYLLSSLQLKKFRAGRSIEMETDIKGEKGAYFVHAALELPPHAEKEWMLAADVNQSHAAIIRLMDAIKNDRDLGRRIREDIDLGTENLVKLTAAADGLQCSEDALRDSRHFSNVLFNIMRGGIFDENYQIERRDFLLYLEKANPLVSAGHRETLRQVPEKFSLQTLKNLLQHSVDPDFIRLATEYLPLKFSRRHGDPSRPWNRFSINTRSEADGSRVLDYEGNWRDIFQNWEALAHSYPAFIEGMIFKFFNASTFDGYNPYRITKDGFDWETIEPDDPWSYIGYWGDHQIIYLLKFLEFASNYYPELLQGLLDKEYWVYANVPYKIKPYRDILKNPKDTIDFDFELNQKIRAQRGELGADGALLRDKNGQLLHVNLVEKILAALLAKLSNFLLEGGIWMNTQRPEWNDANNALVGNGVSMVTLYYLRRFMQFFNELLAQTRLERVNVSQELADFYHRIREALLENQVLLNGNINDRDRKNLLGRFGHAASDYRWQVYEHGFGGTKCAITLDGLRQFAALSLTFITHSIEANQRPDHLYHGYNLMSSGEDSVAISHLSEMLEGQVAVLSAGCLSAEASLKLLNALRSSAMYRGDQHSYLLYPNKQLPGFLQKNTIPGDLLAQSGILEKLSDKDYSAIFERDISGNYHFNGNFKNAADLEAAADAGKEIDPTLKEALLRLFEEVFHHKAFTGRSGTFFGYEGLGAIYWHMVSKLRLAVLETVVRAIKEQAGDAPVKKLLEHFYEITEGIGVHKTPALYGAFPTDPYSHTPLGKGAQQPGMTGQVKEDILCRLGELGLWVQNGQVQFRPDLLRTGEFLKSPATIRYYDISGASRQIILGENALFFTYCQVPVVYTLSRQEGLEVVYENGQVEQSEHLVLDAEVSRKIWNRSGAVQQINVFVNPDRLFNQIN